MYDTNDQYRVRTVDHEANICEIEVDAPISLEKTRVFIAKAKRVFGLDDLTDFRVFEVRQVTERIDYTDVVLIAELIDALKIRDKFRQKIQEEIDGVGLTSPEPMLALPASIDREIDSGQKAS